MCEKIERLYHVDVEGLEDMEENEMEEEMEKENLEEEESSNDNIKKSISKRVIAFALAITTVLSGTGCVLRNNIRVHTTKSSELTDLIQSDNTNKSRDIANDTKDSLIKMEDYLKLSDTLNKLYNKYESVIHNLSLGEVAISENTILPLSEEEYQNLLMDLEYIANSSEEDDIYMQTVKRVISYSSKVNGYILYQSNKELYDLILANIQNDVAYRLKVDYDDTFVHYDYQDNAIFMERQSDETETASYRIDSKGVRFSQLNDACKKTQEDYTAIEKFLSSEEDNLSQGDVCMMTKTENGNVIVYYNREKNKELSDFINLVKKQICSKGEIKDGKFKYQYLIPSTYKEEENDYSSNSSLSNYSLTRKL